MERESFENEAVADVLNQSFVCIKVDREERPDIDHIYMAVCQAMTGHGGWPMSMFLTPDKHPFYAGTYFPRESRQGLMGFTDLLLLIEEKWQTDRNRIEQSGADIVKAMQSVGDTGHGGELDENLIHEALSGFEQDFDRTFGGFGRAPKFPSPHQLLFLLRQTIHTEDEALRSHHLEMVEKTLDCMAAGGIYDHVGGGFSRYSTDRQWLVPHFEKMLYDNALLSYVYTEAFQAFRKPMYETVARETIEYLFSDMCSEDGVFYSAEDADSEGVEGKFYLWTESEIMHILGEQKGKRYCDFYGVAASGNFEGKTILNRIDDTFEDFCSRNSLDSNSFAKEIEEANAVLRTVRAGRVRPARDDKILTGWNALVICALARAGRVFDEPRYTASASRAMDWINTVLWREEDGRLLARYCDGEPAIPAYLDDYVYLTWACLELYEATWDSGYLNQAVRLQEETQRLFWDDSEGGYFFAGIDAEKLPVRAKEWYDGALPSGNSVAAFNLVRLAQITSDDKCIGITERQLRACAASATSYPGGHAFYLCALAYHLYKSRELVLAGPRSEEMAKALRQMQQGWFPNSLLIYRPDEPGDLESIEGQDVLAQVAPFLAEQKSIANDPTLYVCENYACELPLHGIQKVLDQIAGLSVSYPFEFGAPR